jgi:acyl-[acyl-carrier-protein]-phospholipid O-acyltransferase/long-chain-fatty-acid--[acyl-carrier-protein] ligase
VQAWAGVDRRARVIGAVNTLNAVYIVGGSLGTTLLLKLSGLTEPAVLTILGLANIAAAAYFFWRLPKQAD